MGDFFLHVPIFNLLISFWDIAIINKRINRDNKRRFLAVSNDAPWWRIAHCHVGANYYTDQVPRIRVAQQQHSLNSLFQNIPAVTAETYTRDCQQLTGSYIRTSRSHKKIDEP